MLDDLAEIVRKVADDAIMPRFERLAENEVQEKSPGEIVTIADKQAEQALCQALLRLLPSSRVVGEEAAAGDPRLLQSLDNGTVWLVDPLDGTGNFVEGSQCFSTMVALLQDGEAVLSCMYSPALGRMHTAQLGAGAFMNGERVRTAVRDTPISGAILTRFLPPDLRTQVINRTAGWSVLPGLKCAGEEYPAIVAGHQHFALFWRTLPWDHAPGVLFLTEAGGCARRLDATPYRPSSAAPGLLTASTPETWEKVHARLLA